MKVIGFGDDYGTKATVETDEEGEVSISLSVGMFAEIKGFPTPEAARMFAAAILDASEVVEEQPDG